LGCVSTTSRNDRSGITLPHEILAGPGVVRGVIARRLEKKDDAAARLLAAGGRAEAC
jgi:hypothetical protein